ncbi:hypothetical protein IFM89_029799 [Coptis chinensis]|uniref:Plant heme peroxidase family profile domain-containing protein n=1 Tax=Coptis chinensis TaxID=261450 RepID=A0A835IHC0_9MAGN|nr:hypothetical protein IFM89_029799 [Coptis chinensis]
MGIGARMEASVSRDPFMKFGQRKIHHPMRLLKFPATVSCADDLDGGLHYPLYTGRRDTLLSFPEVVAYELPSPHDDFYKTLLSFASRGFDEWETIGISGNKQTIAQLPFKVGSGPDPSLEPGFLRKIRSRCHNNEDLPDEAGINIEFEGETGLGFGESLMSFTEIAAKELPYPHGDIGSSGPDPSFESGFLNHMTLRCVNSKDLPVEPGMN